jgi:hypothetical protein
MQASTRVDPRDARALLTTHLCPSCVRRVLETTENPRYLPPPERVVPTAAQMRNRRGYEEWRALTMGKGAR